MHWRLQRPKPPLPKGRWLAAKRRVGGIHGTMYEFALEFCESVLPTANPPVKNQRFLPAPFRQGGQGCPAPFTQLDNHLSYPYVSFALYWKEMAAAMVKILFGHNEQNRGGKLVISAEKQKMEAFPVENFCQLRYIGCRKVLETIPKPEKLLIGINRKHTSKNF